MGILSNSDIFPSVMIDNIQLVRWIVATIVIS